MNPSPLPSVEPASPVEIWPVSIWREAEARYRERVRSTIGDYLQARRSGQTDPVLDFLFTYYRFPPSRLLRWDPGCGIGLTGPDSARFRHRPGYTEWRGCVTAPPETLPPHRLPGLTRTIHLLEATASRPARFACHGLHEWAMVYRTHQLRHTAHPLRLSPDALATFLEGQPLLCTHFDAFRFFSPAAAPRNAWLLDRNHQADHEQGGCLHANMDLYKWAHKFSPWVGSDLIFDCFLLALDARRLDMQASPYDLRALGYEPVPIETEAGRIQYETLQRAIAVRAAPLRQRLLSALKSLAQGAGACCNQAKSL